MLPSVLEFARGQLRRDEIEGCFVMEVGAQNINGSVRSIIEAFWPRQYIGVDIAPGPGVDEVCNAEDLVMRFGHERIDLLVSTELIEHVRKWKLVISNFKQVLRPGGTLLVTTRSHGFHFHGYPFDFWRYEASDMRSIFADFEIQSIEVDPGAPGVFVKAKKPMHGFREVNTEAIALYSMIRGRRIREVRDLDILRWKLRDYWRTQVRVARGLLK